MAPATKVALVTGASRGIGAAIADLDGLPVRVNPAACSLLGRTADQLRRGVPGRHHLRGRHERGQGHPVACHFPDEGPLPWAQPVELRKAL